MNTPSKFVKAPTNGFEPEVREWPDEGKVSYHFMTHGFFHDSFFVAFPIPQGEAAEKLAELNQSTAEHLFRRAIMNPEKFNRTGPASYVVT